MASSWAQKGPSGEITVSSWAQEGPSGEIMALSWAQKGPSGEITVSSWAQEGPSGEIIVSSWAREGPSGEIMISSWARAGLQVGFEKARLGCGSAFWRQDRPTFKSGPADAHDAGSCGLPPWQAAFKMRSGMG